MSELHLPNADAGPDSPWVAYQPHRSMDILDFACRLYSNWSSHSLENVAAQRKRAHVAEDRALPNTRLLKDVFFNLLRRTPTVKNSLIWHTSRRPSPLPRSLPLIHLQASRCSRQRSLNDATSRLFMNGDYNVQDHEQLRRGWCWRSIVWCTWWPTVIWTAIKTFRHDRIQECWLDDEEEMRSGRNLPTRLP